MVNRLVITSALLLACILFPSIVFADHGGLTLNRLSHAQGVAILSQNSISISSSGDCSDKTKSNCTSLDGIYEHVVEEVVFLRNETGCRNIVVTGGTEVGHATGT